MPSLIWHGHERKKKRNINYNWTTAPGAPCRAHLFRYRFLIPVSIGHTGTEQFSGSSFFSSTDRGPARGTGGGNITPHRPFLFLLEMQKPSQGIPSYLPNKASKAWRAGVTSKRRTSLQQHVQHSQAGRPPEKGKAKSVFRTRSSCVLQHFPCPSSYCRGRPSEIYFSSSSPP